MTSTIPDRFSAASNRDPSSQSPCEADAQHPLAQATPSARHVLPKDLANAIKALSDQDLDRLGAAVLVEQQRRGGNPPSNENAQKQRIEEVSIPMSVGKSNAVRAAFKAGLKPSQIARQFRISQSEVRKALAGEGATGKQRP
jgi:hypothetical protein